MVLLASLGRKKKKRKEKEEEESKAGIRSAERKDRASHLVNEPDHITNNQSPACFN